MINKAFLGLGSNKGDRRKYLKKSVEEIHFNNVCRVVNYSSVYETKPLGNINQNNFLNCVVCMLTDFEPVDLFNFIKETERKLGRSKSEKWGPREIDIDLLFYNDFILSSKNLIIPHRGIIHRDFVLIPILEIEPEFIHPGTKILLKEYLNSNLENHILNKQKIQLINLR